MNVIDDLCEKTGLETYQSTLIKYRIQPEEEHALNQYLFLHWRELDTLTIQDIRQGVAALFVEHTGKPWSQPGRRSRKARHTLAGIHRLVHP